MTGPRLIGVVPMSPVIPAVWRLGVAKGGDTAPLFWSAIRERLNEDQRESSAEPLSEVVRSAESGVSGDQTSGGSK
jgi:hypothetical protein